MSYILQMAFLRPTTAILALSILLLTSIKSIEAFSWGGKILSGLFPAQESMSKIIDDKAVPSLELLRTQIADTEIAKHIQAQSKLREVGTGLPHTDAKIRLFDSTGEPRVTLFRDSAAWCPYCQKVWILLEEKKIPYKIEKINMRSYGDKPESFLRIVPNGLLPAIRLDGQIQTESLDIMLNLDQTFAGPNHPSMWPARESEEFARAGRLMRLERDLFSRWCTLLFRPPTPSSRQRFEEGLDLVNQELAVTAGPWFLSSLSIVDLTYVSHIERMCASLAYWSNLQIRNNPRYPNIDRWFQAFEDLPSYQATKSDYYTHVMDIPPQYGTPYPSPGAEKMAGVIDGTDDISWKLPLPPYSAFDPVSKAMDKSPAEARGEAAHKLGVNFPQVVNFALRGAGRPGRKQFQAPLADPYAEPNLALKDDMEALLRIVLQLLLSGAAESASMAKQSLSPTPVQFLPGGEREQRLRGQLRDCLVYLRDRVGVPRDMSYPAARQLRAHLNYVMDLL